MSSTAPSQRAVRRAKRSLLRKYEDREWFLGVGIVPVDDGLALRLNVAADSDIADDEIPASYYRIPVQVVKMTGYKLRNND